MIFYKHWSRSKNKGEILYEAMLKDALTGKYIFIASMLLNLVIHNQNQTPQKDRIWYSSDSLRKQTSKVVYCLHSWSKILNLSCCAREGLRNQVTHNLFYKKFTRRSRIQTYLIAVNMTTDKQRYVLHKIWFRLLKNFLFKNSEQGFNKEFVDTVISLHFWE